jgi:hypothetical protein
MRVCSDLCVAFDVYAFLGMDAEVSYWLGVADARLREEGVGSPPLFYFVEKRWTQ